ncbi:HTH-type transcriptional repressor YvoA [Marinibacterium anthonyi]|nr:HTH-type transcriptional repressor YvoA [Marinibacterium anthonyi]
MSSDNLIEFLENKLQQASAGLRSAQLARAIENAVREGFLHPGDALPSERKLCDQLGVSRTTLRRALALLEDSGVVDRRLGSGTFITPRVLSPKAPLSGFTQDMKSRGMIPVNRVIAKQVGAIQPDESFNLGLAPGSRVMRLERLRATEESILCLEHAVIPLFAVDPDFEPSGSLYAAMEEKGMRPVKVVQRYGATLATPELARHLQVPVDSALMVLHRLGFASDDRAVEFTRSYFKGDRFYISTELDI